MTDTSKAARLQVKAGIGVAIRVMAGDNPTLSTEDCIYAVVAVLIDMLELAIGPEHVMDELLNIAACYQKQRCAKAGASAPANH